MPRRLLAVVVVTFALLAVMPAADAASPDRAGADPASAGAAAQVQGDDSGPAASDPPPSQEAVGRGGLRYWLIAVLLGMLGLLMAGLGLVYWRVTVPPAKRVRQ